MLLQHWRLLPVGACMLQMLRATALVAVAGGWACHLQCACDPGLVEGHPIVHPVTKVCKQDVGIVDIVVNNPAVNKAIVAVLQHLQALDTDRTTDMEANKLVSNCWPCGGTTMLLLLLLMVVVVVLLLLLVVGQV
jgi:hypothetical protein